MEDYNKLPKSRKEALEAGSNKYYTGILCKNGHDAPKYVIGSKCVVCNYIGTRKYWKKHPNLRLQAQKRWYNKSPEQRLYQHCKHRKRSKELGFSLTLDDIKIPDKCPVLDLQLTPLQSKRSHTSPSIDRINTNDGYHPNNIQVISWRANDLKSDGSLLEHLKIIKYMVKYHNLNEEEIKTINEIVEMSNSVR